MSFMSDFKLVVICIITIVGHGVCLTPKEMNPSRDHLLSNKPGIREQRYEDSSHWFSSAQNSLKTKLDATSLETQAKNIILFIGDGMSVSTVTGARILKGQLEGLEFGEEGSLHIDGFPIIGTSKTYCSDAQIADSACSATAYFTGTKTNFATIGLTPNIVMNDCVAQMNSTNHVSSILAWAQAAGMSTGLVTTTAITEASPAGAYAHIANRDWENNYQIEQAGWNSTWCDDIAEQLILNEPGRHINVILGGGRENLYNNTVPDIEYPTVRGTRTDGKNLVEDWLNSKLAANQSAKYITSRSELLELDINETDYLLGLFEPYHMSYLENQVRNNDPSLAEMTDVAIQILSKNPNGFFLFVEGGRIDHAHHGNWGQRALLETIEFDTAIQLADNITSDSDTLLVVTSDHSHLFNIAGDAPRGTPILGLSGTTDNTDRLPHTTLNYVSGPGYRPSVFNSTSNTCMRYNVSSDDTQNINYQQPSLIPKSSSTHAGEDVLIFSKGPWSHLFSGVNEQNFIPHAMAYAACISPFGQNFCNSK